MRSGSRGSTGAGDPIVGGRQSDQIGQKSSLRRFCSRARAVTVEQPEDRQVGRMTRDIDTILLREWYEKQQRRV